MAKKIIVTVDSSGGTIVEAQGFDDGACLKETESLEQALGLVESRTKKPEALRPIQTAQKAKVGQ